MTLLLIGLILLIGIHLIPSSPTLRARLVTTLGEWPYKGLFALISLIGLGLIIQGKAQAPFVELWQPPPWGRLVPQALMLPAFILLVAAYVPGNLKRVTAHPMLWAVMFWSLGHLMANGDLASVLLFATLGLYALFDIQSANRRGALLQAARGPVIGDLIALLGGVVIYGLILMNHTVLFGVPAMATT